jgi:hypothetical protein
MIGESKGSNIGDLEGKMKETEDGRPMTEADERFLSRLPAGKAGISQIPLIKVSSKNESL